MVDGVRNTGERKSREIILCENYDRVSSSRWCYLLCLCPHTAEALSNASAVNARQSAVCLSVVYIGPNSRTERPRNSKIGIEVAQIETRNRKYSVTFSNKVFTHDHVHNTIKGCAPTLYALKILGVHGIKTGTEIAHITRDSDTTFKVKRSKVNLLLMS